MRKYSITIIKIKQKTPEMKRALNELGIALN
jgi:hypothetical protein